MGKSGRRGKEGGGRKPISTKRRHSGTGSSWKNRRSRSNRPSGGGYKNKGNNQNTGTGGTKQQNNNGLQPIRVNSSGIMSTWKKPLGGLIRYYVNNRVQNSHVDQTTAEDEVDRFYYRSNCNVEETKAAILVALGVTRDVIEKGCIGIDMAIEKGDDDQQGVNFFPISNDGNNNTETVDGRGIKLQQVFRPGEGPAHSNEQWTTIVVPEWAVGQPFFFQVTNFSSLNLSCELILDGEKVAFNAPLLPNSTRTIRPDTIRYYERHQWILNAAKKRQLEPTTATAHNATATHNTTTPPTPRYNGMRPDYKGQRINSVLYPDPTLYGWRFTGAVEESRVEFFEKRMNLGIVKLDFYYTTGTVKSTLHHPTTGRNQLFRTQVTPEQYVNVLKNPRAHTGQGYRHRENRPSGGNATTTNHQQEEDEFDRVPQQLPVNESEMDDASTNDDANTTYFAKDDRYDFKKQGHRNRIHQMNKLEQSRSYAEWKEASKQEYALIHAKFHVSIPKKMYNSGRKYNGDRSNQRRRGKQMNPLPLPEQQHVVNVKAAENCVSNKELSL